MKNWMLIGLGVMGLPLMAFRPPAVPLVTVEPHFSVYMPLLSHCMVK